MTDIFDNAIPKYQAASCILDALRVAASGEEIAIISEMYPDVSWETQEYYYADKALDLRDKFEHMSDSEYKMWLMDLAMFQVQYGGYDIYGDNDRGYMEIHDIIFQAMCVPDMAKRIGFKKLFVDIMLTGRALLYEKAVDELRYKLGELDRFNSWEMKKTFHKVMEEMGTSLAVNPYDSFAYRVYEKVMGLKLDKEVALLTESRAFLFSYDDFMYGLKMNQMLFTELEQRFSNRQAALEESYKEKVLQLYMIAESKGISLPLIEELAPAEADVEIKESNGKEHELWID